MKPQTIMTRGYDLRSNSLLRIARHFFLSRLVPVGNMGGGPGWRCLLVLGVIHIVGGGVFRLITPYEALLRRIYARLRNREGTPR